MFQNCSNHHLSAFFVFAIMILLAACTPSPAATSIPTKISTHPTEVHLLNTPTAQDADPGTGGSRYTIEEGKLSLMLPAGWSALGPQTVENDPDRPYQLYLLGVDPATSGGPGQSKIAILDPEQWTPEAFTQAQCTTCPAQPFEEVTLAGKPARRTQVGGGEVPFSVTWIFFENAGRLIAVDIHDPDTLEPLEDVIQSIQFE